jgi:glyoxylase-like metal-dependent hydrolase (beta-lactamase superfamily II)
MTIRYHILDTGFCVVRENHMLQGGRHDYVQCHATAALIHHPHAGWLLWDTGYASHMLDATRRWPFSLYRRVTPLHIRPEQAVAAQLPRFGLTVGDIRHIIISHFHADHIAGLRDFPQATFIARQSGYESIAALQGIRALRRGFLPALLPDDFRERTTLLPAFTGPALPALGPTFDLLGDGSLLLVELPGHARGQIGMLAQTDRGRVLFAADGSWLTRAIRERRYPHPITRLFVDDMRAVRATIDHLHSFSKLCPDVTFIPTHCPEALNREQQHSTTTQDRTYASH